MPKMNLVITIRLFLALSSGLIAAVQDGQITINEIVNILSEVAKILDMPIAFNVPEDLKSNLIGISETNI